MKVSNEKTAIYAVVKELGLPFNVESKGGRKLIQHLLYLAKSRCNINLGYSFKWYSGPYSEELACDITSEQHKHLDSFYCGENLLSGLQPLRDIISSSHKPEGISVRRWLECVAIFDYIISVQKHSCAQAVQDIYKEFPSRADVLPSVAAMYHEFGWLIEPEPHIKLTELSINSNVTVAQAFNRSGIYVTQEYTALVYQAPYWFLSYCDEVFCLVDDRWISCVLYGDEIDFSGDCRHLSAVSVYDNLPKTVQQNSGIFGYAYMSSPDMVEVVESDEIGITVEEMFALLDRPVFGGTIHYDYDNNVWWCIHGDGTHAFMNITDMRWWQEFDAHGKPYNNVGHKDISCFSHHIPEANYLPNGVTVDLLLDLRAKKYGIAR